MDQFSGQRTEMVAVFLFILTEFGREKKKVYSQSKF
jgi:hypothetical protein